MLKSVRVRSIVFWAGMGYQHANTSEIFLTDWKLRHIYSKIIISIHNQNRRSCNLAHKHMKARGEEEGHFLKAHDLEIGKFWQWEWVIGQKTGWLIIGFSIVEVARSFGPTHPLSTTQLIWGFSTQFLSGKKLELCFWNWYA